MKQELEQLRKELNERIDAVIKQSDKTTQFEKGKWYWFDDGNYKWIAKFDKIKGGYFWHTEIYGVNFSTSTNGIDWRIITKILRLATPSEIQEALTKEAIKRGFGKGIKCSRIRDIHGSNTGKDVTYVPDRGVFEYKENGYYTLGDNLNSDVLSLDGNAIYAKGIWAEIVAPKEEPIMIGGKYEVKFSLCGISVNEIHYSKEKLEEIKKVLELTNIKSINVGCNGQFKVDLNLINKILSRF